MSWVKFCSLYHGSFQHVNCKQILNDIFKRPARRLEHVTNVRVTSIDAALTISKKYWLVWGIFHLWWWRLTSYSIWYTFFLVFLSLMPLSFILLASSETGKRESIPRVYSSSVSKTNLYWFCNALMVFNKKMASFYFLSLGFRGFRAGGKEEEGTSRLIYCTGSCWIQMYNIGITWRAYVKELFFPPATGENLLIYRLLAGEITSKEAIN